MPKIGYGYALYTGNASRSQFLPDEFSGLSLWLKADAGVSLSGSNVTAWADQSGNGNNATMFNNPQLTTNELNSKPVISFDGSTNYGSFPVSLGTSSKTIFIVGKYNNTERAQEGFIALENNGTFDLGYVFRDAYSQQTNYYFNDGTYGQAAAPTFTSVANYHIATVNHSLGSDSTMGINGVLGSGSAVGVAPVSGGVIAIRNLSFDDYASIKIAEIIIYNRALTTAECQRVETYLASKYAIQLPNINNLFLPQLWLKADAGVTLSGSDVTAWADQSGNGNNANSSPGTRPTFVSNTLNAKPVLRFDGTGQKMALTSSIGGTKYSIFIVCKNNDNTNGSMFFWSTDNNFAKYIAVSTDINYNENARNKFILSQSDTGGGGEGSVLAWSSASANNNFFIGTAMQNGGGKAYLNSSGGTNSEGTFNASNTFDLIGGYGFGYELDGDVAEIIAYNRALSDSERQQVEGYLNAKYAIY